MILTKLELKILSFELKAKELIAVSDKSKLIHIFNNISNYFKTLILSIYFFRSKQNIQ